MNKISRAGKLLKEIYETLEIKKERTVMKRIRKLTTAFLVIALLVTSLVSVPAFADEPAGPVERIAGDSRYLTAVEVSKKAYDETAETVVLASGENFPDALTGSVLAHHLEAPILLAKKDSIDDKTLAEIARLKGDGMTITILGGEKAIGAEVETTLKKKGYTVERVEGASRYDTAVDIAEAVIGDNWDGTVFLATGETPWDALAVGPYAASQGIPILLTPSDSLRDVTAEFLLAHKGEVTEVVILGGDKAVSPAVVSELENLGIIPKITRIEGANRELTALAIASAYADSLSKEKFIAVTGSNFPDAILGAYFGASFATETEGDVTGALPIVLVRDGVKEEVDGYIRGYAIDENGNLVKDEDGELVEDYTVFEKLYIIGGPKAVSDEVEAVLEQALYRLPAEVEAEDNEFYVGNAADDATFTYTSRLAADKVVIVIDDVTMKASLHADIFVWDATGKVLTVKEAYLNDLKVGEYKVAVTIDGFVMEEQTIVVKALPTKATLEMTIDPDKVTKDSDETIKLSLTGYMPADDPEADGTFLSAATGAEVVVGGKVLTVSTDYTVSGTDITLEEDFLNTLIVGKHNVSVEIAGYPKATGSFEIVAAEDAAAETYVTFDGDGDEDEVKSAMAINNDNKDLSFFMYKGTELVAIDAAQLEISVAGKKLTKYDYTTDSSAGKVTIKAGYVEDLKIDSYEIAVTYDKKALNKLTLEITVGAPYKEDSSVVIKDKDAGEIEILEIVPVKIKVVDSLGNPVLGGKTVEVTSDPTTVALSLNSDMSRATTSPIFVKLDKNGEATLYLQADAVETSLTVTVTLGSFTITSGAVKVVVAK